TLEDNFQVLYGAALALAIVVLLTPAVGGMARLLGVVDQPDGRRVNRRAVPRLGGLALFLGIFVPALAFLDLGRETRGLLLGAAVCAISAGTFSLIALSLGKPRAAIATAIVLGATLGFLRHNFYPARIFMGDSGALLLGFMLAAISIQSLLKTAAIASLFFPLLVLAVPIIDTSFVVARRVKHGRPVYAADRAHLHHRFLNIGFS